MAIAMDCFNIVNGKYYCNRFD